MSELTVGTLCAQAGCNRGTFYYHFADLDALVYRAIEQELLGRDSVAAAVFGLLSGTGEAPLADMADERRMRRMGLLLEQGGTDLVTARSRRSSWACGTRCCAPTDRLCPPTRASSWSSPQAG